MDIQGDRTKSVNPERGHTLAWFWRLGLISEEAMHELAGNVSKKIIPTNSSDILHIVDDAVTEVEDKLGGIFKTEPWLHEIKVLESKVKTLEDKLDLLVRHLSNEKKTTKAEMLAKPAAPVEPKKPIAKPKA